MQVLAALDAKENGVGEAVLLNDQSEVCEGISGNVFVLKNNQLFTHLRLCRVVLLEPCVL